MKNNHEHKSQIPHKIEQANRDKVYTTMGPTICCQ